jgi:hypothetical protein
MDSLFHIINFRVHGFCHADFKEVQNYGKYAWGQNKNAIKSIVKQALAFHGIACCVTPLYGSFSWHLVKTNILPRFTGASSGCLPMIASGKHRLSNQN